MHLNGTELRSLLLATGLLLLGTAARLGFGPGPDDFSWSESSPLPGRPARDLSETLREVTRGASEEELAARPLSPDEQLDPNLAPATHLRRLPGIGPARARAIVKERETAGFYLGPGDLERVPGIGPRTVEALAPHLSFDSRANSSSAGRGQSLADRFGGRVDVNRAQIKELEQITGIGPALAARIVATRRTLGPFRNAQDLLRVPGIGEVVLERIRGQVRF
ncbi:MAG: helix-hairpin-helix domain-containing protein [Gemmatimonadetes bacterium]|nr:helix-hairpin-helix domain-containing protein [Gemmatimonadota bacterium]